jgi:folate-binding protein YgfZ
MLKGRFHSLEPVGSLALETLRIEAGIPVYGVDVDETNMMLETGLADAVSFSKGCYTGQEAVAMATYRGHISKQLMGLKLSGDSVPATGSNVSAGEQEIGRVTSSTLSPATGGPIAMAYLKYGFLTAGLKVLVASGHDKIEAETVQLPFYSAD